MQVRIFESQDMASGLRLVRKELGPDALILSTKTVRNGKLGLLGKPTIEITAAIDPEWPEEKKDKPAHSKNKSAAVQNAAPSKHPAGASLDDASVNTDRVEIGNHAGYSANGQALEAKTVRQILSSSNSEKSPTDTALRSEVDELKSLVQKLAGQVVELHTDSPDMSGEGLSGQLTISDVRQRLARQAVTIDPVTTLLTGQGVEPKAAESIATYAKKNLDPGDYDSPEIINRFVTEAIEKLIDVQPPSFDTSTSQLRLALIGPTGVGKTTTLAKLAAHHLINVSNSVALITIDTYRIAAVEQLKVYGEIMHLPVEVVISPEQLEESLARHADKDLVLIDTAGRSPKDSLCISELTSFLHPDLDIQKHLVLSATTRENELMDTIGDFEKVGTDRTIFTKVDECTQHGVILNVQLQNQAPLSFITNGQRVPEDLLQITTRSVAELIMSHNEGIAHD